MDVKENSFFQKALLEQLNYICENRHIEYLSKTAKEFFWHLVNTTEIFIKDEISEESRESIALILTAGGDKFYSLLIAQLIDPLEKEKRAKVFDTLEKDLRKTVFAALAAADSSDSSDS